MGRRVIPGPRGPTGATGATGPTGPTGATGSPGPTVTSLGYTAAAPLTLTMLGAGHTPGMYLLNMSFLVRTAAGAGTLQRSYAYSNSGAKTIVGFATASIAALGNPNAAFTNIVIASDGVNALDVTLTPAGVAGSPVVDVYASAYLVAT